MTQATKNKSDTGFFIEMSCPGCGGELHIGDDFFILDCNHCGSIHRLIRPDSPPAYLAPCRISESEARFSVDRYCKKNLLPLTENDFLLKKIYYPFWKIDAVLFKLRKNKFTTLLVAGDQYTEDVTCDKIRTDLNLTPFTSSIKAGCRYDGIPSSLGIRSDYIGLTPYDKSYNEDNFKAFPILKSWDDIRPDLKGNLSAISGISFNEFGVNQTELFAPRASLVYFPFLVLEDFNQNGFNRFVVDGVTGRMLEHVTKIDLETDESSTVQIDFGALKVVPYRSSNFGEDLPSQQASIYLCHNCQTIQYSRNHPDNPKEIYEAVSKPSKGCEMFPFWSLQMPADVDLRLKQSFGGIHKSDKLIIPAFKVSNFDGMYRLSKRMSAASGRMKMSQLEKTDNSHHPVALSLDEAIMHAGIFIYRSRYEQGGKPSDDIEPFVPEKSGLFYAPFRAENYFYIDAVFDAVTFERRILH